MPEHPIEGLMKTAMENLKDMVDVNTIIGDPVEAPDGSVILTVSKVGFGFATGGSEFVIEGQQQDSSKQPFGGGSGGGVSITPIAFLIVGTKGVQLLHLNQGTHLLEKMLDVAPAVFEKVQSLLDKSSGGNNNIKKKANGAFNQKQDKKSQQSEGSSGQKQNQDGQQNKSQESSGNAHGGEDQKSGSKQPKQDGAGENSSEQNERPSSEEQDYEW
ncbi:GerW family sporulation protein [Peribacillus sp. SCS-155]|uniref:GerW family sporulation protein n=1 Tax=Peribacillus sedimenti TaxID=3115297 RepID=UPI0039069C84